MNTAKSVAYGWGALVVAAGVSYYYAKQDNRARWLEQSKRGERPTAKAENWQEKLKEYEDAAASKTASAAATATAMNSTSPSSTTNRYTDSSTQTSTADLVAGRDGSRAAQTQNSPLQKGGSEQVKQMALPTGVDTGEKGSGPSRR